IGNVVGRRGILVEIEADGVRHDIVIEPEVKAAGLAPVLDAAPAGLSKVIDHAAPAAAGDIVVELIAVGADGVGGDLGGADARAAALVGHPVGGNGGVEGVQRADQGDVGDLVEVEAAAGGRGQV